MTRRQSIAKPPMEDSYGRLHRNIDVREIKQVVNILHIHRHERLYLLHENKKFSMLAAVCRLINWEHLPYQFDAYPT